MDTKVYNDKIRTDAEYFGVFRNIIVYFGLTNMRMYFGLISPEITLEFILEKYIAD